MEGIALKKQDTNSNSDHYDPPREFREEGSDVLHEQCEAAFSGTVTPIGT